ncbi:YdcF family protein [Paenibacillus sp. HN-1]|uniref:YdcF family protein n=1 Tax=Paenibacillus TaxID=44249 RepID=UPI001CA94C3D|nr:MULTISPECIES: YdcF family protein [Paenibacillus]MBY9082028.1 YdcF family protein [Paenibacillus sp. CGMCC 1.18879]MBY9085814.1 YdcF family protein [Paenibacillus sinensis]
MKWDMTPTSPIRPFMSRPRRRYRRGPLLLVALILTAGLIWSAYILILINGARTTEPMRKADAGIVLGMAMWGDQPSPGLRERLDYAIKLYKQGAYEHIIVTGGLDRAGYRYTEGQGMRNYLISQGIQDSAIRVENEATSTYENLLYSRTIMQQEGWTSAVIVTHTFHGRRALEIARYLGYDQPELGLTESETMSMFKYKTREILAYTKWKLQETF